MPNKRDEKIFVNEKKRRKKPNRSVELVDAAQQKFIRSTVRELLAGKCLSISHRAQRNGERNAEKKYLFEACVALDRLTICCL